jgi:alkanesulfonate monooxygenase SsuD/methylene tetrahydromethanopterin reductase-like flavin-dependent oxidoreductase (luciferase family)
MIKSSRKLHLVAVLGSTGHHAGSWRHPNAPADRSTDIDYLIAEAQKAERALFDALFLADSYAGKTHRLEPFTHLAALAAATERIGLIATVSTVYNEPYLVARHFASLDHLSRSHAVEVGIR